MGVFRDLMDRLELDVATVHGRKLPIVWRFDPEAPPELAWCAYLERVDLHGISTCWGTRSVSPARAPSYVHSEAIEAMHRAPRPSTEHVLLTWEGATVAEVFLGPSGEDPLRALSVRYARLALERRELGA